MAVLADYRCGCTWVGSRLNCLSYCAKHGENRRTITNIGPNPKIEQGWCWQVKASPDTPEEAST